MPITAEDVRWTWQAQTSPEVAWSYADLKDGITDVEVVDPHTVRFRFEAAYSHPAHRRDRRQDPPEARLESGAVRRSGGRAPPGSATTW